MCRPNFYAADSSTEKAYTAHETSACLRAKEGRALPQLAGRVPDPGDCLSIYMFDWDDTLFPTSALVAGGPELLRPVFDSIDSLVMELLESALSTPQSHVMLLTSANISWLHQAASDFLPRVSTILLAPRSNMSVVSAHRLHGEAAKTTQVPRQKVHMAALQASAMQDIMSAIGAHRFQVISVGDSPFDLEAAHALAFELHAEEESYVKTIAMKPAPAAVELVGELRALGRALPKLAGFRRSFHQSMCRSPQPVAQKPSSSVDALVSTTAAASEDPAIPVESAVAGA